jgi:hypothetical protein
VDALLSCCSLAAGGPLAVARTLRRWWLWVGSLAGAPQAGSHSLTVPSELLVFCSRRRSGSRAKRHSHHGAGVAGERLPIGTPVAGSHSRTLLSALLLASRRRPSASCLKGTLSPRCGQ